MSHAKTIVIRPPEYWPGLATAALMQAADILLLADTFQYSRQSLQNRMRLRNPDGWQWVSVPLKSGQHGRSQSVTRIRPVPGWRKRHWKAILYNYSQSPYFEHYEDSIKELYLQDWNYLSELNMATIRLLHQWLNCPSTLIVATKLDGEPNTVEAIIANWSDVELLAPVGVPEPNSVTRLYFSHPRYRQTFEGFFSDMSVLDLIFNYGPQSASMLRAGTQILSAEQSQSR